MGLSIYILWKFKDEINEMGKHLIGVIGEYDKQKIAIIIAFIIVVMCLIAFRKYKLNQIELVEKNVQDIYNEMEEELEENIEENFECTINLEAKLNDYCEKKKIDNYLRERILVDLNLFINENSNLKKQYIYIDGKVIIYVKLNNDQN